MPETKETFLIIGTAQRAILTIAPEALSVYSPKSGSLRVGNGCGWIDLNDAPGVTHPTMEKKGGPKAALRESLQLRPATYG